MEAGNTDDLLDYLKLDPDHHEKIASLIPQVGVEAWQVATGNIMRRGNAFNFDILVQETWYEVLIRYGLYIGAIFQMACIMVTQNIIIIVITVIVIIMIITVIIIIVIIITIIVIVVIITITMALKFETHL